MRLTYVLVLDPRIRCCLELAIFCLCTALLFRPLNRTTLWSRIPFFLLVLGVLLVYGLGDTALAFGTLGERVLGRPLYADPSELASRCGEAWIGLIVIGTPWAVANLVARRAILLNVVALVASAASISLILIATTGAFVWYL